MKDQKSLIINSLTSFKEMQVRQPPEGPFKSTWLPVIFVVTWVFEITVQEKKRNANSNIQSSAVIPRF